MGEPLELDGYLESEERYRDVDLDDRTLPVWVAGGLKIDAPEPLRVAVAVNGVIGGWSNAYVTNYLNPGLRPPRDDQLRRWGMLVSPELLEDGRNEIEVFLLGDDPDDELRPLDLDD